MPTLLPRRERIVKTVPDFGPTWPEVTHGKEYRMEQKNNPPVPVSTVKPIDKVKPPTPKSRTWERER